MTAAGVEAAVAAVATAEDQDRVRAPALVDARAYSLLIVPVRLALGLAGLSGALVLHVSSGVSLGEFGFAAGFTFFLLLMSRRRRAFWKRVETAQPADEGVPVESALRTVVRATYPSTIGLTALTAIALAVNPVLAAFLAGILAGMALASLQFGAEVIAWERWHSIRLLIGGGRQLYVR